LFNAATPELKGYMSTVGPRADDIEVPAKLKDMMKSIIALANQLAKEGKILDMGKKEEPKKK